MDVKTARRFWEYLAMSKQEEALAGHLRREIVNRLVYLDEVGLSYLTLALFLAFSPVCLKSAHACPS